MAESRLGQGNRAGDRRRGGLGDNVKHTEHGGDMVGDKRKLKRGASLKEAPSAEASRSVPIASTVGETKKIDANNGGGGRRAVPKAMKLGEW